MVKLHTRTLALIHHFGGGRRLGAALAAAALVAWLLGRIPRAMTTLEGPVWNWPLALAVLVVLALVLASYIPFVRGCRSLRSYLRRHANLPMVDAFSRLPGRAAQKMSVILLRPPQLADTARALQQLRLLRSQCPSTRLHLDDELRADLDRAMSRVPEIENTLRRELEAADGHPAARGPHSKTHEQLHDVAVTLVRVLASQWRRAASDSEPTAVTDSLQRLGSDDARDVPTAELYARAGADKTWVWLRLAEDFVAARSAVFVHDVLDRLRRLLTAATSAALLMLVGLAAYPFERRTMLLAMAQGLVVAMVISTMVLIVGMERSEVLARMRKLDVGKVTWNRSLVAKISIYGLLPVLSVVATVIPSVGKALFGWVPAFYKLLQ